MLKLLCALLFCVIAVLAGAPAARAQAVDYTKMQDIPSFKNELPYQQFLASTIDIAEQPRGDRFLAYHVRLPKTWKRVGERADDADTTAGTSDSIKLSRRLLGKIVKYVGNQTFESTSRFEVSAVELDHQITARNWFLGYILSNGYTLQGMKSISDSRVDALYVLVDNATPYIVRTTAIINGPRMVIASYYTPEESWKKERATQEYALNSFQFDNPEKTQIEAISTYAFLDLLRFDYPASWRLLAPNINSVEGMDARLINSKEDKKLIGEINMRIISTELETSLPQEVSYLKEGLQSMGLKVGDLVETPTKYKYKPQVTFARVEVYNAVAQNKRVEPHEYWLAVMAEDRYYYIISMITPSRTTDFYNWAQNTEAFQTIVQSMRP